jgi:ribonuclease J
MNSNNSNKPNNNPQKGTGRASSPRPRNNENRKPSQGPSSGKSAQAFSSSRGAAIRAQRRAQDDAQRIVSEYSNADNNRAETSNVAIAHHSDKIKVTFLGGLDDVGEKNTAIIEYDNDAIILDCGNNLGVDLPGINYEIADPTYLQTIKHKIKGYVITHGHLDHIGGLKHIVPLFPAPIYGSRFTLGIVEKTFEDLPMGAEAYEPRLMVMNIDDHERLMVGCFTIELVRVTHSIPEATLVCIDTPVGRIIATGDFRLDPEPLDHKPSDITRLRQLGDEGVLLLLSESSYSDSEGRTPTEHTLQDSFHDVIAKAEGRIFCAVFSSNMNRTQMIINAAAAAGRKVALDGRSMIAYAEIAVRQGILKVPKGTFMAMKDIAAIPDEQILVMATGGQGEPNAALQKMSEGTHRYIKLKPGDTVVVSSSPIPGNEIRYDMIGNNLSKKGVHLYRHPTHEIDGCGPLHVSGHARRDEMRDMIRLVRPKFMIPVHAGALRRRYHADLAIEESVPRSNVLLPNNGDSVLLDQNKCEIVGQVPHGSLLVDQSGSIVSGIVVKDRVLLAEGGLVSVILTIDRKSGQLMTSPDIISRGFIYMKDSEELVSTLRAELKRAVQQRFKRVDLDRFKAELKDHITHYLFEHTGGSPIVIPVVNIVGGPQKQGNQPGNRSDSGPRNTTRQSAGGNNSKDSEFSDSGTQVEQSPEQLAADQQKRFQEMRARLLGQDPRTD